MPVRNYTRLCSEEGIIHKGGRFFFITTLWAFKKISLNQKKNLLYSVLETIHHSCSFAQMPAETVNCIFAQPREK